MATDAASNSDSAIALVHKFKVDVLKAGKVRISACCKLGVARRCLVGDSHGMIELLEVLEAFLPLRLLAVLLNST